MARATTMEGPLGPWTSGIADELGRLGYRPPMARQIWLARRLSRFMDQQKLKAHELSAEVVEEFCRTFPEKSRGSRPTSKSFVWLVAYLERVGVVAVKTPPPSQDHPDQLVDRFRRYLLTERSLAKDTVVQYVRVTLPFLNEYADRGLDKLVAGDVTRFMTRACQSISARGVERLATGLRAFLGFALVEGIIAKPLASAVPSAARWSGASLPRGLAPGQVAALLASCDQSQATGRRDYAILVTLVRLGLRAAEVAGLRLDDIDWRAGEIVIRGKGGTEERLPLPPDVGRAIVAYLRHARPERPERELFLRAAAPLRGLTPDGLSEVVRAASERAGLGSFGSHRLRHTAGTDMLRAGATLSEVAQVLRHRSVATTAIYAKVDHLALRQLAMPWPGGDR